MLGTPRPTIADEVGGGKALSADPGITIIPRDVVGLKVSAYNELADGVGAVLVDMTDLVTESAVATKEAKAVVRGRGHVSCNAEE